jgi:hypothetical protein
VNQENTRALLSKFPFFHSGRLFNKFSFFYPESSLRGSSMAFGFDCGDGWYKLLLNLCDEIQVELNKPCDKLKENFRVVQVKEKFGGLRFYVQGGNDKIDEAITKAEDESLRTCEMCGKKGDQKGSGYWIRTLCKKCRVDEKKKMAKEAKRLKARRE